MSNEWQKQIAKYFSKIIEIEKEVIN